MRLITLHHYKIPLFCVQLVSLIKITHFFLLWDQCASWRVQRKHSNSEVIQARNSDGLIFFIFHLHSLQITQNILQFAMNGVYIFLMA